YRSSEVSSLELNKIVEALFNYHNKGFIFSIGVILSLLLAYFTASLGVVVPILSIVLGAVALFFIIIFKRPVWGLMFLLTYCFIFVFFAREFPSGNYLGYGVEALYVVVWMAIILKQPKEDWRLINKDLCLLFLIWFLISVLQLINPAGASPRGWLHEIRSSGMDSLALIPAGFLLLRKNSHINTFLIIIIACSFLATINGVKQLHLGLSPGEQTFLAANSTHMVWGQLRVFSFYGDAGQFGASQAHLVVICSVLAFGSF